MPNWCSNGLSVTGGGELLERFAEWLPRCETEIADANQGAGSIWVEETFNAPVVVRGAVCFSFQTAWSPPVKVCDRIAELWPRLRFELDFNEPLQGYRGFCHWSDGRAVILCIENRCVSCKCCDRARETEP